MTASIEINGDIKFKGKLQRRIAYNGVGMGKQFIIDENTVWLDAPKTDGFNNLTIKWIGSDPHLQFICYERISGNHVDVASVPVDVGMRDIAQLEYVGKVIIQEVQQIQKSEP
jgi:hypothetical protein